MSTHIIHKQQVILHIPKKEQAYAIQNAVSDLLKNELPAIMEKAFDEIVTAGEIIRIDCLQLDLGITDMQHFEQSFTERFTQEISKAVREKKAEAQAGEKSGAASIRRGQSLREGLLHFLQHGTRAWYDAEKKINKWDGDMLQRFTAADWQYVAAWLQTNHLRNPVIIRRLAGQFPDDFLFTLLHAVAPSFKEEWKDVYEDLLLLFDRLPLKKSVHLRHNIWMACYTVLLDTQQHADAGYFIAKALFLKLGISPDDMKRRYGDARAAIQTAAVRDAVKRLADDGGSPSLQDAFPGTGDGVQADTAPALASSEPGNDVGRQKDADAYEGASLKSEGRSAVDASYNNRVAKKKEPADEDTIREAQYVTNSGIVLLHPFLEMYFAELKLLHNRNFADTDACRHAVLLLHYLATGETEVPEYDLTLQKVLCNLSWEETLPNKLELTDTEKEESEKLLHTVIEYWPPLNNTSVEGLRSTFLQREGKLSSKENGWLLTIDQKTVDILLGRLPWGFSTIRLPWMNTLLSVDWC